MPFFSFFKPADLTKFAEEIARDNAVSLDSEQLESCPELPDSTGIPADITVTSSSTAQTSGDLSTSFGGHAASSSGAPPATAGLSTMPGRLAGSRDCALPLGGPIASLGSGAASRSGAPPSGDLSTSPGRQAVSSSGAPPATASLSSMPGSLAGGRDCARLQSGPSSSSGATLAGCQATIIKDGSKEEMGYLKYSSYIAKRMIEFTPGFPHCKKIFTITKDLRTKKHVILNSLEEEENKFTYTTCSDVLMDNVISAVDLFKRILSDHFADPELKCVLSHALHNSLSYDWMETCVHHYSTCKNLLVDVVRKSLMRDYTKRQNQQLKQENKDNIREKKMF